MDKFKFLSTVNLLLIKENKILLTRRFNTGFFDGSYECPSGHVDGKETMRQACVREALEEVGVKINIDDLDFAGVVHRYGEKNERIEFYFKTEKWEGEPKIMEPEECDDMAWFPLDSLPENMVPKAKAGVENYLKGILYSEFDWK